MKLKHTWGAMALASPLMLTSGQVAAQGQSALSQAMLEEVVVTARRREENLQDLPLSIQAITADAMDAQGIYNLEQITDFVPNVSLSEENRANDTRLFIRGIGGGFSNPAQVFGVGAYIDGHYLSGSLGAFMSTVDVERVEVLRGPQGTLFGKNTTGGAISLVSAKPGPDFDSYVTLRAGNYGQADLRGMINVPLSDSVFFRGNFASETNDGYYYNEFLNTDTHGRDQQSLGLALRWEASENWTIDARLSHAQDRDDNNGSQCFAHPNGEMSALLLNNPANYVGGVVTGSQNDLLPSDQRDYTVAAMPFAGVDGVLGNADDVTYTGPVNQQFGSGRWGGGIRIDSIYPGANAAYLNDCERMENTGDIYLTSQNMNTRSDVDNSMFNLDATWDSGGTVGPFEAATVQLKGAWRQSEYQYQTDRDFSGLFTIDHVGNNPTSSRGIARWTNELEVIFNGQIGDRWNLTAGAYWFEDDAGTGNRTCLNQWIEAYDPTAGAIVPATGAPEGTINGMFDDDIECIPEGGTFFYRLPDTSFNGQATNAGMSYGESTALYAHAVYSFNDNWDLAVGARAMEDTREQAHIEYTIAPGSCSTLAQGREGHPGLGSGLAPALEFCNAQYIMNRDTILNNGFHANVEADFSEVTPTVSLSRHLNPGNVIDSGMIYGTISEGYLHGAFNDELNPNNPAFTPDQRQNVLSIIPYGPENVTNYEVGFKGTLLDGRLQVSTAIFLMDYTDKQEAIEIDNSLELFGPDPNVEYTQNAADVEITGIELELRSSPWDGGFVSLDFGVLNSEYSTFLVPDLDNLGGPPVDASASSIANRTPDWTLTATVEHAFLLGNGATLTPQLGVYMQDEYEWLTGLDDGVQSPHCHQDSYSKWRARISYEPADANWEASLYGNNIADEEILTRCGNVRSGAVSRMYQAPSWWGAQFTMRFGGN